MRSWIRLALACAAIGAGRDRDRDRDRDRPADVAPPKRAAVSWSRWFADPRSAVLLVLVSAIAIGGGRKALEGWRARRAVERLGSDDVRPDEVLAAAAHGRPVLLDLFRILGTAKSAPLRESAGRALAHLWSQDNLITEEEKALVQRGFAVEWRARRRYPRSLRGGVPIAVTYGVPFLNGETAVQDTNLEWSHLILGARRAGLESFSDWRSGPGEAEFTIVPTDFESNGPHRLVLQSRVRTVGLTDAWELELPLIPFTFELDPLLDRASITALPDDARAVVIGESIRLEAGRDTVPRSAFLPLDADLAIRNPPRVVVASPLPCDLAHAIDIEFEGQSGRIPAGVVVLGGQGSAGDRTATTFPLELEDPRRHPMVGIEQPGRRNLRVVLTPDLDRGWAAPEIRSLWPGTVVTNWVEVEVVRR